jgi:hypothetical protein
MAGVLFLDKALTQERLLGVEKPKVRKDYKALLQFLQQSQSYSSKQDEPHKLLLSSVSNLCQAVALVRTSLVNLVAGAGQLGSMGEVTNLACVFKRHSTAVGADPGSILGAGELTLKNAQLGVVNRCLEAVEHLAQANTLWALARQQLKEAALGDFTVPVVLPAPPERVELADPDQVLHCGRL